MVEELTYVQEIVSEELVTTNEEIVKSRLDDRSYKYLTLVNGMKCILIHDPQAEMGAASLDVKVGSAELSK